MSGLSVTSISISELLDFLKNREWLTPKFQRDFVWSIEQIKQLVNSIINGRPIGMVTLWAQPDVGALELEPITLPDGSDSGYAYFTNSETNAKKLYAILDGRQRSTSIAMAFGGFRSLNNNYKYSGKFFLNVSTRDETYRVEYFKDTDLKKRNMESVASQISNGYFPLFCEKEDINSQWMDYISHIRDKSFYSDNTLPNDDELSYREEILRKSFNGIINTKLAVYIVPEKFSLGEICEIFETLNTTGTKVSTVDLIHSWLYSDTVSDAEGPIYLRDWIQEMGEVDGTIGWSDTDKRPELMAQMSTACYVSQNNKPTPRQVGGRTGKTPITSVKAGDLLATPKEHWKNIIKSDQQVAEYFSDFQDLVGGGRFPWTRCPYPVSAMIYIALRWHKFQDSVSDWGIDDLNAIYRAFFWRNSLAGRYDQGFLTQLGTDLANIKEILAKRKTYTNASKWSEYADEQLDNLMSDVTPDYDTIFDFITNGRHGGARQKTLNLLLYTLPKNDLLENDISLSYPINTSCELHHIYPKSWFKNNKTQNINLEEEPKDWINSTANLMLLSRESNNKWKSRFPDYVIQENDIDFNNNKEILESLFIDEYAFSLLNQGAEKIMDFWEHRSSTIAKELQNRIRITL